MKAGLRLSTITFTLFMINSAIEAGHAEKVTFDEFYTGLDRQTLFEDVQAKLGEDIDLGLVTSQPDQKKLLLEMLESTRGALEGR